MDKTDQPPYRVSRGVPPEIDSVSCKSIPRKHIINKLNHLNFSREPVFIAFSTADFAQQIEYEGYVEPCTASEIQIRLLHIPDLKEFFRYRPEYVRFKTSRGYFRFTPLYFSIAEEGITVEVPNFGEQYNLSEFPYIHTKNCKAVISQHSVEITAMVKSYASMSFVCISESGVKENCLVNPEATVYVQIYNNGNTVFSAGCRITWYDKHQGIFHLTPDNDSLQRFPTKEYRSARIILDNLPQIHFIHPLSNAHMEFTILDISGTGFSITNQTAMLFPGLRIHEAHISFPDGTKFTCDVQVIHRKQEDDQRAGMAILDIDPQDHLKLLAILHTARDPNAFLCKKVNIDRLMEFFFDSGFIYPQKYLHLLSHKERILSLFRELYNNSNNISRHFIYQKGDTILGHLAMLRFFENAWLIHHHASLPEGGINAGIHVLNQATSYITDSYRYHNMHLNYILCFFRPDNKFPRRVFGELTAKINNPRECSIDEFAYCHLNGNESGEYSGREWTLTEPNSYELQVLADFYERASGGLLLEAMDILPHHNRNRNLIEAFREAGINRNITLKVLQHEGKAAAFLFLNASDPGLNMSDLTNSLIVIITDTVPIEEAVLRFHVRNHLREMKSESSPMLIYPRRAVDNFGMNYEKIYNLWIIQSNLSDIYHDHISGLFRGSVKNLSSPKVSR